MAATIQISCFSERIIHVWNFSPCDIVNYTSMHAFKRNIERNNFNVG